MKTIIFPGQGTQKKGMGNTLFDRYKELVAVADKVLGYSIKELCLGSSDEKLQMTKYTQPAVFVVNHMHYCAIIEELGAIPNFLAGHSLGEYNALVASGTFDFETGLMLVKKRSELMSQTKDGFMAAITGLNDSAVEEILLASDLKSIAISNYNSDRQVVVSGLRNEMESVKIFFENAKANFIPLPVSGAFHSHFMKTAAYEYEKYIETFEFLEPQIKTVSNVTARFHSGIEIKPLLVRQITSPVKWRQSIQYLLQMGDMEFLEMGTGNVLNKLIVQIKKDYEPEANKNCIANDNDIFVKKEAKTLVDVLKLRAKRQPEQLSYTFLDHRSNSNIDEIDCTYADLDKKAKHIAALLQARGICDQPVLIVYPPGIDYICAFVGCLYARAIAVPLYPPASPYKLSTLISVAEDSGAKAVLTTNSISDKIISDNKTCTLLNSLDWISADNVFEDYSDLYKQVDINGDTIAFLQYTSGSTAAPKGVIVTHSNLMDNSEYICDKFSVSPQVRLVSWLPPYHDMGLIGGVIQPIYAGMHAILMSPMAFIKKPVRWLQAIMKYKATHSGGPNFSFDLCAGRVTAEEKLKLDLSSLQLLFSGAEPIRYETMKKFSEVFSVCGFDSKSFYTCYGLAENTLLATGAVKGGGLVTLSVDHNSISQGTIIESDQSELSTVLVSSGRVDDEKHCVKIVRPDTKEICLENQIGEIWVSGKSVAKGYWRNESASRETFNNALNDGTGPYLNTEDLGFYHKNDLYVCGRKKDLIIIRGSNYYPQDIELIVEDTDPGFRQDRVVAFSIPVEGEEKIVIVAEYKNRDANFDDLYKNMIRSISDKLQLAPYKIVLVGFSVVPITTSGKVMRRMTKQMYLENKFDIMHLWEAGNLSTVLTNEKDAGEESMTTEDSNPYILQLLREKVSEKAKMNIENIKDDTVFGQYGLVSVDFIDILGNIEDAIKCSLEPTIFYDYPDIRSLAKYISDLADGVQAPIQNVLDSSLVNRSEDSGLVKQEEIAIIGIDVRFPGAQDYLEFWKNLKEGTCSVSQTPFNSCGRLNHDSANEDDVFLLWGGFIGHYDSFDYNFFGISQSEAELMDPQQRIFLESAWRAIEDAGYNPKSLSGSRTGVYVGVSSFDFLDLLISSNVESSAYLTTGSAHTFIANRVSYFLDFHGPSEVIDTACSGSLVAVNHAVKALQNGDCELAIAGGVNLLLASTSFSSLKAAGVLSETGRCYAFDKSADGYVRGEGVGTILLKPLSKAIHDNDPIYAVIKGLAENHGGRATSLTAPNPNAQTQLVFDTYKSAGVPPDTISYIEAHGTGTLLGDPIEMKGLKNSFELLYQYYKRPVKREYCRIGSVKNNIGHLESAAGIAGIIKLALSLRHKTLFPIANFNEINPYIDLRNTPFYISKDTQYWRQIDDGQSELVPRRGSISSFGIGGTCVHMILEEDSRKNIPEQTNHKDKYQIIILSAQTLKSLQLSIRQMSRYIADTSNDAIDLQDLAFTLQTSRESYDVRIAILASDITDLRNKLGEIESGNAPIPGVLISSNIQEEKPKPTNHYNEDAELEIMARHWVAGGKVQWNSLYRNAKPKRIHFPGYCFERQTVEIPTSHLNRSTLKSGSHAGYELTKDNIVSFLKNEVSHYADIPLSEINVTEAFHNYGLDSLNVINVYNNLSKYTGIEIPSRLIYDCPDIDSLSEYVISGENRSILNIGDEVYLDETIIPSNFNENHLTNSILLTGATGFLGCHLLREMIKRTDADIYCLVRASDNSEGLNRIKNTLEENDIFDFELGARIKIVLGDLTKDLFGLTEEAFSNLADSIDVIYHCAAQVDWMRPYIALKPSNVHGTHEIIRFACRNRVKHLHYISTLTVFPMQEDRLELLETYVDISEGIIGGYGQSKWVGEQLCRFASERGLPVSVYRFDFAGGAINKGIMKETDFIVRLIEGAIEMKCIPEEEFIFNVIPVDQLSYMILSISLDNRNINKIFNLINTDSLLSSDIADLLEKRGYHINKVTLEQWKKLINLDQPKALYPLYPFIKQFTRREISFYRITRHSFLNTVLAMLRINPNYYKNLPSARRLLNEVITYAEKRKLISQSVRSFNETLLYWDSDSTMHCTNEEIKCDILSSRPIELDLDSLNRIRDICIQRDLSIAEVVLASMAIMNSRYDLNTIISFVIPVMNKTAVDLSIYPLRPFIKILASINFQSFMIQMKKEITDAHESICNQLGQMTNHGREASIAIIFRNNRKDNGLLSQLSIDDCDEAISINSNFILEVCGDDLDLQISLKYNPNIYTEKAVSKIISHFSLLFNNAYRNLNTPVFLLQNSLY